MDKKQVQKMLDADLATMDKRAINAMRQELKAAISWWQVTPISDLKFLGLFGQYQAMLNKEKEMLEMLKK